MKIENYLKNDWKSKTIRNKELEEKVIQMLPSDLREEIYEQGKGKFLRQVSWLSDDIFSRRFLLELTSKVQVHLIPKTRGRAVTNSKAAHANRLCGPASFTAANM